MQFDIRKIHDGNNTRIEIQFGKDSMLDITIPSEDSIRILDWDSLVDFHRGEKVDNSGARIIRTGRKIADRDIRIVTQGTGHDAQDGRPVTMQSKIASIDLREVDDLFLFRHIVEIAGLSSMYSIRGQAGAEKAVKTQLEKWGVDIRPQNRIQKKGTFYIVMSDEMKRLRADQIKDWGPMKPRYGFSLESNSRNVCSPKQESNGIDRNHLPLRISKTIDQFGKSCFIHPVTGEKIRNIGKGQIPKNLVLVDGEYVRPSQIRHQLENSKPFFA